ncbi:EAL domain-containing protein [Noviherbaspirillum sp. ST9]|uniref:EAL domain-containing protein n=1 Tax=Noviherbaspirillum sp. ST9 TaxID=3401606 RepID=UPI003B587E86
MLADLPKRILYLEDNAMDADLVRRGLARQAPDMGVDVVSSVSAARAKLEGPQPPYDLILSDLNLPDGTGLELLSYVRERNLPLAVVILTGSGDQEAAIAALKAGADDYVVKRADYGIRLIHTLAAALARFRSELAGKTRLLRVLYAEHSQFDIDLTRRHFARHAPQVRLSVVTGGAEVLDALPPELAGDPPFDVVLLDYQLSGVNALEVAKVLRDERGYDVPVVLVTGQGSEDVVAEALRLGVADYLMKHEGYLVELPAILEHAYRQVQLAREQAKLRTTSERLRHLLAANPTILYSLKVDGDRITPVWMSENMTRLFGYTQEECLKPGWWIAGLHPDDRERVFAEHRRLYTEHSVTHEYRFRDKSGAMRWVRDDTRLLLDASGMPCEVVGSWSDVTASHEAGERQRLQAAALTSSRDAVMITDLGARILSVNPAFTEITGYTEAEATGRPASLLQSGRQDRGYYDAMWNSLREGGQWQGEIWNRRKNGEIYPQWLTINTVRDDGGTPTHYVAVGTDLTQLRRSEEQREHLANYDPLTGLPNRALLRSLLQHALEKAQHQGGQVAVLFLNLDKFKTINDSLGHGSGDSVLLGVTGRLNRRLGGRHFLGRLSADEFVIVMEEVRDPGDAEALAVDLLVTLDAPFLLEGASEVYARTSIGISLYPQDATSAHDLLHRADAAVHRAKESGGNQIAFYTSDLSKRALAQLEIDAGLRRALSQQEFVLHYQPKANLETGRITGAEALLRWIRPGHGLVPPNEFIPLAEKNGHIIPIGAWVIDEACRQIRAWNDAGLSGANVAVNVSARQFHGEDLERVVAEALERHGVPAWHLTLELTESMLIDRPDQTIERLQRLKQIGLQLSLDDFGTGYSSLAYLSRFPLDQIKIDRSFVVDLVTNTTSAAIANSVIDLAHRMQLKVIAEGVETREQLDYLRKNACDEMQGFYLGKPVPAEEFGRMLREGRRLG